MPVQATATLTRIEPLCSPSLHSDPIHTPCCYFSLQVRAAVRAMLETRAGEPPLTGRELRLLVAMLDSNSSDTLTRQEFEDGLRDCRCACSHKGGEGGAPRSYKGGCQPAAPRGGAEVRVNAGLSFLMGTERR